MGVGAKPGHGNPVSSVVPTHHACAACGHPLHRLRAVSDPHYGLGVVVCPGCRAAVVRRRDPVVQGFRTGWKTARALLTVGVQGLVLTLGVIAATMLIRSIARSAMLDFGANPVAMIFQPGRLISPDPGPNLLILITVQFLLGLFVGAWARSALGHLRAVPTWLVWSGLPLAFALLPAGLYVLGRAVETAGAPWGERGDVALVGAIVGAAAQYAVFVLLGMPLGRTMRQVWVAGRRARWSKRRRARRRLRDDR